MQDEDKYFMKAALAEAKIAFLKNEVPVGSVLVYKNKIIARAHNLVESFKDPTLHAEMLCIKKAIKILKNWRLLHTVLYSTLEPCVMCAGAIILSRIKKIVWAANDIRTGAGGSLVDLFEKHPIHKVKIKNKILEKKASDLMKDFFRKKRY